MIDRFLPKALTAIDEAVRAEKLSGMIDGTRLTIEFISGFEKFNTRPYHCYETWCQGWRITDPELGESGFTVEREHLIDAWGAWLDEQS